MHRFFASTTAIQSGWVELDDREAHHAAVVLRLNPGSKAVTLDGIGTVAQAVVHSVSRRKAVLQILSQSKVPPSACALILVQSVTKGKSMDFLIQKATELGVSRIWPIIAERSVVQLSGETADAKAEKWRWIAVGALKQSGGAWLPKIEPPIAFQEFAKAGNPFVLSMVASLQNQAIHAREAFEKYQVKNNRLPESVAMWIGPEGDFTPEEYAWIQESGAVPISLGALTLRSETAAIFSLACLQYEIQWQTRLVKSAA